MMPTKATEKHSLSRHVRKEMFIFGSLENPVPVSALGTFSGYPRALVERRSTLLTGMEIGGTLSQSSLKRTRNSAAVFLFHSILLLLSIKCTTARAIQNPFTDGGCLFQRKENWTKKRVCSSEDSAEVRLLGYCEPNHFEYMEIRIASQNWEASFFETWILQTVLSEILAVPTSVETTVANVNVNYYDPENRVEYGMSNDWSCLERAKEFGDCTLVTSLNQNASDEDYACCSHFVPEVWDTDNLGEVGATGVIDRLSAMGTIGEEFWFVPKFTAQSDPTLTNYIGLAGEENRQKLADRFKRPVRWGTYCLEVSTTNCTAPDDVAARAPQSREEANSFFNHPNFTGYFRKTYKNDCVLNPFNCTGTVIDYPCGWTSYVIPQIYHLGIALDTDGREAGSGGYTYEEMVQIFYASNYTKSDIISFWWTPEALYQGFLGTDMEFTKIVLPPVSKECIENRITADDRCSADFETRVGDPLGACDEAPHGLKKVIAKGLFERINADDIPEAMLSPAYDVLDLFQISGAEVGQMFDYRADNVDDPRRAICDWMIDNFDVLEKMIPRNYPRTLEKDSSPLYYPLSISALFFASLAVGMAIFACFFTFIQRNKLVIKHAQIEFLCIILAGLFLVSCGALMTALPPTNGLCLGAIWTTNVGFSLELVPLIVKMAAFYRLIRAARRMRHVKLTLRSLFGAVILLTLIVVGFLIAWSLVDPPRKEAEYRLTDKANEDNEIVVSSYYYCNTDSQAWNYASVGWHLTLLITATIQAFQTRSIRKEINESQTLAIMIYSHFVFVILRLITLFLYGTISSKELMLVTSLIFSLDAIAAVSIYFIPKFLAPDASKEESEIFMESSTVKHLQMLASIATSQHQLRLSSGSVVDRSRPAPSRRFTVSESALRYIADPTKKKEVQALSSLPSTAHPRPMRPVSLERGRDFSSSSVVEGIEEASPNPVELSWCGEQFCCPKCGESCHLLPPQVELSGGQDDDVESS